MVVDTTSVYWVDGSDVRKVPIGGGVAKTLVSGPLPSGYLAVDASSVYWTAGDAVLQVPLDGTAPPNPAYTTFVAGQGSPQGIAVDAANIYWVNAGTSPGATGSVVEMPVSGGSPTTLATGRSLPSTLILAATHLIWVENTGIWTFGLNGGGAPTLVAPPSSGIAALAFDGTDVCWITGFESADGGTVQKAPLSGGAPVTLASNLSWPNGIAVDAKAVYWSTLLSGGNENTPGTIVRAALDGSAPCTVYSGAENRGIAEDATSIYWIAPGGVWKATPK